MTNNVFPWQSLEGQIAAAIITRMREYYPAIERGDVEMEATRIALAAAERLEAWIKQNAPVVALVGSGRTEHAKPISDYS